ncbi:MAG: hypothetical protein CM1200mP5_5310 [Candidatus Pelagibacterales bacterium]|nr:MAG: hypothetical protein CM1200mP5_5310 [Pelagibacterales bacterium]
MIYLIVFDYLIAFANFTISLTSLSGSSIAAK